MMYGADVPIPELLKGNRRDKRGYPIPYIVFKDKKGKYNFTVNDGLKVKRCLFHNRCGLCGNKMGDIIYFVGGAGAALHPNGAYIDPPMHKECATYALQVCPFLAFRKYNGAKSMYVLGDDDVTVDESAMKGKPPLFILKGTKGFVNMGDWRKPRLVPTSTEDIEYWKDGRMLDEADDEPTIAKLIDEQLGVIDNLKQPPQVQTTGPMQSSLHVLSTLATRSK